MKAYTILLTLLSLVAALATNTNLDLETLVFELAERFVPEWPHTLADSIVHWCRVMCPALTPSCAH